MTLAAFLFGLLIAVLIASGFHLWRGGNLGKLLLYIIFSCIGFWLGHFLGESLGWTFFRVGAINLGMSILVCFVFLWMAYWLSLVRPENVEPKAKQ